MANTVTTLLSGNVPEGATGQAGQRLYVTGDGVPTLLHGDSGQALTQTQLVSQDSLASAIPAGLLSVDGNGVVSAKSLSSSSSLTVPYPTLFMGGITVISPHLLYTMYLDNAKGGLSVVSSQTDTGSTTTKGGGLVLGYPSSDANNANFYSVLTQLNQNGKQVLSLHVRGTNDDDITKSFIFTAGQDGTLILPNGDEVATVSMLKNAGGSSNVDTSNLLPLTGGTLTGTVSMANGTAVAFQAPNDKTSFSTLNANNPEGVLAVYSSSSKGSTFWTFGYDRITKGYYGQENAPEVAFTSDIDDKVTASAATKVNKTGDTLTGYYVIPYSGSGGNAFTFGDVSSGKFTNLLSDSNGNMNFYTPSGSWVFGKHTATTPDGSTVITDKELPASLTSGLGNLSALTRTAADLEKMSEAARAVTQPVYANVNIVNLFNWTGGSSQNSLSQQNKSGDPDYKWNVVFNDSNAQYNNDDFSAAGGGFYVTADSSTMPGKLQNMPFFANFQYQLVETQDTTPDANGKYNHHLVGSAVLHVTAGGFDQNDKPLTGANALGADYRFGTDGKITTPRGEAAVAQDFTSGFEMPMASSFDSDKSDFGGTVGQGSFKVTVGAGDTASATTEQWGYVKIIPSKTNGGWATYDFPTPFKVAPTVTLTPQFYMWDGSGVKPMPPGTSVYLGQVTDTSFALTVVDSTGNQMSITDMITVNFRAQGF